ncbi:PadR family transcriptional regulator [Yinghuangia sp. YIM S10712]|uniref:PadR family transcriptional regulator n=1 Tax=Yinghuangia sp. YIM S10712 TaxID=3436930 RepID=UPI003F5367D8
MTPVFGHGRLRLYLLKLLDESPRHGYEIIRLLQDRFLGLYAPSAGTVYPRLAKLEQEGLVTHSVEGGRKVYRITDAGRAELADRRAELDALESEIRASVYERAREIRDEVRTSARNLRDELRQAARDIQDDARRTDESSGHQAWQRAGKQDPVSAWARNLGPTLSQKMVDLAEGLAQGLAGITEQHTRHLEDELRRHFGPDPAADKKAAGRQATDPWCDEADGVGGAAGPVDGGKASSGTSGARGRDSGAGGGEPGKTGAGASSEGSSGDASGASSKSESRRAGAEQSDFEQLFDCFRSEIHRAAGHAGLTAQQVDRARDVLVRACADLKAIFNER